MSINELSIYFFPGGGHNHDGENSSLIETNAYSIFDFNYSTQIGGPSRSAKQQENLEGFRQLIIDLVNNSILAPAGLILQEGMVNGNAHIVSNSITASEIAAQTITSGLIAANAIVAGLIDADAVTAREIAANTITADEIASNTITANEIAANTITANEIATATITADLLSANIVLINQVIASNNYVTGVSGWAIDGNGVAEFSNSIFRGTVLTSNIQATGGSIGGWDISSDVISSASGDIALYADDISGSLVAGTNVNNQISLLSDGSLSAVASNIETTINVPYIFGGNQFTFIVKSVTAPLNAVRISPSRVLVTTTNNQIGLDANDGINTNLGIIAGGQIEGDTIYSNDTIYAGGTGVYYNTSNLPGSRFGMSFGWDAPIAAVSFIVNNDTNVDGYILPDGFYSDRRIKSNISPLGNELLEKIYSIKTYEFDYNDNTPHELLRGKHDIGVIADEIELLFPEIVINKNDPEKYRQVLYIKAIPLLLGVIGDLNSRLIAVEQLNSEINELKSKVSELESYLFNGPNNEV
jgi:hypothetical protein